MAKIAAFEKKGLAKNLCQGIGETISKVQPGRMAASPPKVAVGFACDFGLLLCNRLDHNLRLAKQVIKMAACNGITATVNDDCSLDIIGNR